MASVASDYESTAEHCGVEPDRERLAAIRALLAEVEESRSTGPPDSASEA